MWVHLNMNYPVFIFHELVLRIFYINRSIGRYVSSKIEDGECLISTTSGKIKIGLSLLDKQYHDPAQISQDELAQLVNGFEFAGR